MYGGRLCYREPMSGMKRRHAGTNLHDLLVIVEDRAYAEGHEALARILAVIRVELYDSLE
jgi:hypothetical protein